MHYVFHQCTKALPGTLLFMENLFHKVIKVSTFELQYAGTFHRPVPNDRVIHLRMKLDSHRVTILKTLVDLAGTGKQPGDRPAG